MTLTEWELKRMDIYNMAYVAAMGDRCPRDEHSAGLTAMLDFERAFPRPVRSFMGPDEADRRKVERRAE